MKDTGSIEFLRSKARAIFSKHSLPRWMVFLIDSLTVGVTFILSYFLRYNFEASVIEFQQVFSQLIMVLGAYCGFELVYRSFAGLIRHTTVRDIFNVILTTSSALILLIMLTIAGRKLGWPDMFTTPISILLIHFVTINGFMYILRILIKMTYELVSYKPVLQRNVVIFGAGSMGVIMKGVIESDRTNEFRIVAFLDNDKKLQNKSISGIPVHDPKKLKESFIHRHSIQTMVFAIRDIPTSEKSEILKFAVDLGLEVLEVPPVERWLNGKLELNQLQKIRVEDLLRRDPIEMNLKIIERGLHGKVIMVTGAAGSIGSEIVRQLTKFRIRKLILVDNAETSMFHLENELQHSFRHAPVRTILADVTDQMRMDRIFRENQPEILFHAAAYKHVPLMEENPYEAVRVNIGGTDLLTRLAVKYEVNKFVMVSTDKAVNPTNVMGASKRVCEMILRARSLTPGNRTQFVITRFGNVLGSSGSVIPIFRKQIEEGGPVTVTHPEITRYFMTIPEACQLVLEAGFMGLGGEIFVFDMGDPVKILHLARQMITLAGMEPDEDIKIEFTGLRPGEKLYEELLNTREKLLPTYNPKVMVAQVPDLDYQGVLERIHNLLYSFMLFNEEELVGKLSELVPEYESSNVRFSNGDGDRNGGLSVASSFPSDE